MPLLWNDRFDARRVGAKKRFSDETRYAEIGRMEGTVTKTDFGVMKMMYVEMEVSINVKKF